MMHGLISILFFFWMSSSCSSRMLEANANIFNVVNYGAVGDGKTESSKAFLKAWEDVCQSTTWIPTLLVPGGKTFLLNPVIFDGPCKPKNLHVKIDGTLVAPKNIKIWGDDNEKWLQFSHITNLIVSGRGKIDGQGAVWWEACKGNERSCDRPTGISFRNCDGLRLSGLTHINSAKNHISINQCNGVEVSNLHIFAPEYSPNTDGIDISKSTHMNIRDSVIGTGDDCIAINGFSNNIGITGITCGPGHGISIGSLGKHGAYETVEDIHVNNCTLKGTTNGLRIKTWRGGSGYVKRVSYEQIKLVNVKNPIIIDQNYNTMLVHEENTNNSGLIISDITYQEVYGTSAGDEVITLNCLNKIGCTDIVMEKINIAATDGKKPFASCVNAHGRCSSAFPTVPCLSH